MLSNVNVAIADAMQTMAERLARSRGVDRRPVLYLPGNAGRVGAVMQERLRQLAQPCSFVGDVRGVGLMLGIELARPCGEILNRAAEAGLMLSVTADKVVRLVPPLILSEAEAAQIVAILAPLIKTFLAEPAK